MYFLEHLVWNEYNYSCVTVGLETSRTLFCIKGYAPRLLNVIVNIKIYEYGNVF